MYTFLTPTSFREIGTQSVIYFLQDHQDIKIGHTTSLAARCIDLRTGNPRELILIGVLLGNAETERELHLRFSHLAVRGEWFHFSQELQDFLGDKLIRLPVSQAALEETLPAEKNIVLNSYDLPTAKVITNKFDTTCKKCGKAMLAGESIVWLPEKRVSTCTTCWNTYVAR